MATVNDAKYVRKLLANGGRHEKDKPVIAVIRYRNMFNGGFAYGICWSSLDVENYLTSPFCLDKTPLWSKKSGLTSAGRKFLEEAA